MASKPEPPREPVKTFTEKTLHPHSGANKSTAPHTQHWTLRGKNKEERVKEIIKQNQNSWRVNVKVLSISDINEQKQTFKTQFRIEAFFTDNDVNIQHLTERMESESWKSRSKDDQDARFYWDSNLKAYALSRWDTEDLCMIDGKKNTTENEKAFAESQYFYFKMRNGSKKKEQDKRYDDTGFFLQDGTLCWPSLENPLNEAPLSPMGAIEETVIVPPYLTLYKASDKAGKYLPISKDGQDQYCESSRPEEEEVDSINETKKIQHCTKDDLRPIGNVRWNITMSCTFMLGDSGRPLDLRLFPHDVQILRYHFGMRRTANKKTMLELHGVFKHNEEEDDPTVLYKSGRTELAAEESPRQGEVWRYSKMWASFGDAVHSTQIHFHVPTPPAHARDLVKGTCQLNEIEFRVPYTRKTWYFKYMYCLSFSFTTITLYAYCIPVVTVADRGSVLFLILLTVLTFTFATSEQIPKVDYPTLMDVYNYMSLVLIMVCAIETAIFGKLSELNCKHADWDVSGDNGEMASDTGTEWDVDTCPHNYRRWDSYFIFFMGFIWLMFNFLFVAYIKTWVKNTREKMAGDLLEDYQSKQEVRDEKLVKIASDSEQGKDTSERSWISKRVEKFVNSFKIKRDDKLKDMSRRRLSSILAGHQFGYVRTSGEKVCSEVQDEETATTGIINFGRSRSFLDNKNFEEKRRRVVAMESASKKKDKMVNSKKR